MSAASFVYSHWRSREESNMASDPAEEMQIESESSVDECRRTCWNWSGERTFYFLTGLLYNTFLFLLRVPKYDWLFICSVARVKQNVAERKRREVQAVPAEMQSRNALYVADVGKNEASEQENAQRLPGSAFDPHRVEIQQSEEEIKVNSGADPGIF